MSKSLKSTMLSIFKFIFLILISIHTPSYGNVTCVDYFKSSISLQKATLTQDQRLLILLNSLNHFEKLKSSEFILLLGFGRSEVSKAAKSLIESIALQESENYKLKYGIIREVQEITNEDLDTHYNNLLRDAQNSNSPKDALYFESFKTWKMLVKKSMPYATSQLH